jgi:ribA/ribD-fused uncharacterized protein
MRKVIDRFRDEYECFSNFFIEEDGLTVEHRFQAAKSLDPAVCKMIMQAGSPQEAKKLGRSRKLFKIRPDWEQVKDSLMEGFVREKFLKYKVLRAELLATDDAELIEGNWWHDAVWGMVKDSSGKWVGENRLGNFLMKLRSEFRDKVLV